MPVSLQNVLLGTIVLFSLYYPVATQATENQAPDKWTGHIEAEGKWGNERTIGEGGVFLPLHQDENSLLFGDIRGRLDDQESEEYNIGLGYRKIINNSFILGGYGFYDHRKTPNDNSFDQATIGIEFLTPDLEFRVNGYIPEQTEKATGASGGGTSVSITGGTIQMQTIGSPKERALPGFDVEFGKKFDLMDDWSLWAYGGIFHFDAEGYDNVSGPRGRLEISQDNLPFLGQGSRFTIGVETQSDDVRGRQTFGIARLRVPLNFYGNNKVTTLSALDQRMTARVIRDVDIVSAETTAQVTETETATVTTAGGNQVSDVTTIKAGDNIATAVVNAGADALIVLNGDDGTINTSSTINVQSGQTIMSGGQALTVTGSESGRTASLTLPGSRATVNYTTTVNNVFNIAQDNVVIKNLDITGGRNGLNVINATGVVIENMSSSGAKNAGISADNFSIATIRNSTISNSDRDAIVVQNGASLTAENMTLGTTTNSGVFLLSGGKLTLSDSTISNSGSYNIYSYTGGGGNPTLTVNSTEFVSSSSGALSLTLTTLSGSGNTVTASGGAACTDWGGNTGSIAFDDILGGGAGTCP